MSATRTLIEQLMAAPKLNIHPSVMNNANINSPQDLYDTFAPEANYKMPMPPGPGGWIPTADGWQVSGGTGSGTVGGKAWEQKDGVNSAFPDAQPFTGSSRTLAQAIAGQMKQAPRGTGGFTPPAVGGGVKGGGHGNVGGGAFDSMFHIGRGADEDKKKNHGFL